MFCCLVPPNVAVPVMDLTVNKSDTAVLRCSFQGNPPPSVTWTGPGDAEVINGSNSATIEVFPCNNYTVESVLTISPAVRMDHEGEYTCQIVSVMLLMLFITRLYKRYCISDVQ